MNKLNRVAQDQVRVLADVRKRLKLAVVDGTQPVLTDEEFRALDKIYDRIADLRLDLQLLAESKYSCI